MAAVTAGPPVFIDGPLPTIRPYRLIDVATIVDDPDPHWRAGAQVWPYPTDLPDTWVMCPPGTGQGVKSAGVLPDVPIFGSFQVYLPWTCSAFSVGGDYNGFTRRAVAAFNARESYGVEREFSQGISDDLTPYLADADATPLNGGAATAAIEALEFLEDAIGTTGQGGVIHAAPATVTAWESTGFTLDKSGSTLTTRGCGTPVVVGTGYRGAIPVGHGALGAQQQWAFATGPVQIRRGDIDIVPDDISQALNRTTNTVTGRIERDYLAVFDPATLQVAILVDRTL